MDELHKILGDAAFTNALLVANIALMSRVLPLGGLVSRQLGALCAFFKLRVPPARAATEPPHE